MKHTDRRSSKRRRVVATAGALALAASLVALMAAPASATLFSNTAAISIPAGPANASPYPSTIAVSGLTGTIVDVNVTLFDVDHTWPDDIDVVLAGPTGADVILMTDVGGSGDITSSNIGFSDGAGSVPDSALLSSGTYSPTQGVVADASNCCGYAGSVPSGPGFGSSLSVFNTTAPNGTWSLYVYDDTGGEGGSIAGGWQLEIITNGPTITSFAPTTGPPGTSVVITGTNLTGATSVTFGGVAGTLGTNTGTSLTATVPTAAITGPIAVTTPNGTATSATNFTVIPVPTIASLSPTIGQVGTSVVITGTNLTGATSVKFGSIVATFGSVTATSVTATVPAGASTGTVSVTTPGGTATSAGTFVVQHARAINLHFSRAGGTVAVLDGFSSCASSVPVKLQHKVSGDWKSAGADVTNASGAWSIGGVNDPGKYRAIAKPVQTSSGDKCLKDISPTATL